MTDGVQIVGRSAVLLEGPALRHCAVLVGNAIAQRRIRNGVPPSTLHLALHDALVAAARHSQEMSDSGHADVPEMVGGAESGAEGEISSSHAAELLHLTPRQVRRIATHLDGRRVAGRWTFPRAAVQAVAADRNGGQMAS